MIRSIIQYTDNYPSMFCPRSILATIFPNKHHVKITSNPHKNKSSDQKQQQQESIQTSKQTITIQPPPSSSSSRRILQQCHSASSLWRSYSRRQQFPARRDKAMPKIVRQEIISPHEEMPADGKSKLNLERKKKNHT